MKWLLHSLVFFVWIIGVFGIFKQVGISDLLHLIKKNLIQLISVSLMGGALTEFLFRFFNL